MRKAQLYDRRSGGAALAGLLAALTALIVPAGAAASSLTVPQAAGAPVVPKPVAQGAPTGAPAPAG